MIAPTTTLLAYIPSPPQGVWHLGPVPVRAYALCIIVGIILAVWWGDRRWIARGGQPGEVLDVAIWAVPFGLIGGRIYHVLTDWQIYFGDGGKSPIDTLRIWDGGLGIWGAVIFGALGAWIGCRRHGIKLPAFGDAIAPPILLAQAIGRLGNYFNQELYGRDTTVPWGLEIFERSDGYQTGPGLINGTSTGQVYAIVHPTFLYEMVWNLLIVLALVLIDRQFRIGHGRLFALYVAGYCAGRFIVELLRSDTVYTFIAGIRINVFTSALLFVAAAIYFVVATKGRERGLEMYHADRAEELEALGAVGYVDEDEDDEVQDGEVQEDAEEFDDDAEEFDDDAQTTDAGDDATDTQVIAKGLEEADEDRAVESDTDSAPEDADSAQSDTDSAPDTTDSAQPDTDSAQSDVDSAREDVDGAQSDVDSAQSDADSAPDTTDSAPDTTDSAPDTTDSAPEDVDSAREDVDGAQSDTDSAPDDVDGAQSDTDSAPDDVDGAQSDTDGASDATESEADVIHVDDPVDDSQIIEGTGEVADATAWTPEADDSESSSSDANVVIVDDPVDDSEIIEGTAEVADATAWTPPESDTTGQTETAAESDDAGETETDDQPTDDADDTPAASADEVAPAESADRRSSDS
ncbi:prolipoprotein diacylglyceryl transferase [Gordonia sp. VNK1]|uniref:prolipoprotein diacylglyceryl transferase n=1 Tax=Gordonia oleivorans TaxID=3156618 RepID=UPI0032B5FE9A